MERRRSVGNNCCTAGKRSAGGSESASGRNASTCAVNSTP
jgi:hypothetical protein